MTDRQNMCDHFHEKGVIPGSDCTGLLGQLTLLSAVLCPVSGPIRACKMEIREAMW